MAYCWSFPKLGDASIAFATKGLDAKRADALEKFKEELGITGKLRLWLKTAVTSSDESDDVFKLPEDPCEDDSKKLLDPPRFCHLFEDMSLPKAE
ncbi:hypothetical protein EWM64_g6425 [Hericium alpestre]|uniref:Uncharacterized protein n=1 Tax=Hericium alpestre TaxID=135208 RepID=A0A4Y9ZVQ8_9AGAM|nr:hypothetical protein EWM64_g6425 [Hericium alpestre]